MSLIELQGVEKRYGELIALKGLDLKLDKGRIGLLGPNGAGKSTFIKILLGLIEHDAGQVKVLGHEVERDPTALRHRIGYMPEGDAVIADMSAHEYTALAGELCGLPRAEAISRAHMVLHYVGLGEARYRQLGTFSTGMKQRARLAQALVGDPELLLLDEPTSGLDPRGRDEMLQLIVDIPARTGTSVLLSTHILPDVEKTCDQVVVLSGGSLLYAGALAPLVESDDQLLEVRVKGESAAFEAALRDKGCEISEVRGMLQVRVPVGHGPSLVLETASAGSFALRHVAPLKMTLERAFLETLDKAAPATESATA